MNGHLLVEALDKNNSASLSYNIVTNYLQKKLNFKGLIITDALGMKAITKNLTVGQIALQSFMAGNDILLFLLRTVQQLFFRHLLIHHL